MGESEEPSPSRPPEDGDARSRESLGPVFEEARAHRRRLRLIAARATPEPIVASDRALRAEFYDIYDRARLAGHDPEPFPMPSAVSQKLVEACDLLCRRSIDDVEYHERVRRVLATAWLGYQRSVGR